MGQKNVKGSTAALIDSKKTDRACLIGICAMRKKTTSKPMVQILDRLRAYKEIRVNVFEEEMILEQHPSKWPVADCLICFFSTGFPVQKAVQYVELRKPFCINDVASQQVLTNRFTVYRTLQQHDLPTPKFVIVDREKNPGAVVIETPDYIEYEGIRINKPLVEKPKDADNHNVIIYYAHNGGSRRLFRKTGNRSSRSYPKCNAIRKRGSYLYEEFQVGGHDLKVYTIGPAYAHAELRKSPTVDGLVIRDPDGKELRRLTKLTDAERSMVRAVVCAFRQNICGFDIIRTGTASYVIDVNGWSFVKGSQRYYDKCARILRKMCLISRQGRSALATIRTFPLADLRRVEVLDTGFYLDSSLAEGISMQEIEQAFDNEGDHANTEEQMTFPKPEADNDTPPEDQIPQSPMKEAKVYRKTSEMYRDPHYLPSPFEPASNDSPFKDPDNHDVLLSMVTIFRHGDRTSKQKVKFVLKDQEIVALLHNAPTKELKIKKQQALLALVPILQRAVQRLKMGRVVDEPPKGPPASLLIYDGGFDGSTRDLSSVRTPTSSAKTLGAASSPPSPIPKPIAPPPPPPTSSLPPPPPPSSQPSTPALISSSGFGSPQKLSLIDSLAADMPRLSLSEHKERPPPPPKLQLNGNDARDKIAPPPPDKADEEVVLAAAASATSSPASSTTSTTTTTVHISSRMTTSLSEKDLQALSGLEEMLGVIEQKYGGAKVQIKPRTSDSVQVVCKWGGEMTHAGFGQVKQYVPVFWDHITSYGRLGSDLVFNDESGVSEVYDNNATVNAKSKPPRFLAKLRKADKLAQLDEEDPSRRSVVTTDDEKESGLSADFFDDPANHGPRVGSRKHPDTGDHSNSRPQSRNGSPVQTGRTTGSFGTQSSLSSLNISTPSTPVNNSSHASSLPTYAITSAFMAEKKEARSLRTAVRFEDSHGSARPTTPSGAHGRGPRAPSNTRSFVQRLAFLHGMKVYSSDEGRVYQTAKAFVRATYEDCLQHSQKDEAERGGLIQNLSSIVRAGEEAQVLLSNIDSNTRALMEKAKAIVATIMACSDTEPYFGEVERMILAAGGANARQLSTEAEEAARAERIRKENKANAIEAKMREEDEKALQETECPSDFDNDGCEKKPVPVVVSKKEKQTNVNKNKAALHEGRVDDPDAMTSWGIRCLRWLKVPKTTLRTVYAMMLEIQAQIHGYLEESSTAAPLPDNATTYKGQFEFGNTFGFETKTQPVVARQVFPSNYLLCHGETLLLVKQRWDQLIHLFYNPKTDTFDATKVPDIYDCVKYDALHNNKFIGDNLLAPLYLATKRVADFIVPQEYGVTRREKDTIARGIIQPFLNQLVRDLEAGKNPQCASRVTLHFSSESHLHALRNIVFLANCGHNKTVGTVLEGLDLNFLSHGVFRLYENVTLSINDPYRFYVSIQFSPGAGLDPFVFAEPGHVLPVSRPVPVHSNMPFATFKSLFLNPNFVMPVPLKKHST